MDPDFDTSDWTPLPALLEQAKEAAIAELHRRLSEAGHELIRPSHGCVFRFVEQEGTRLTELAARAGLSKQAVGEFVADLEQMGYVERIPDPDDRRAKIIRLTERGIEGRRLARQTFADIEREWAQQIGEERMATLRKALERIVELERAPAKAA